MLTMGTHGNDVMVNTHGTDYGILILSVIPVYGLTSVPNNLIS